MGAVHARPPGIEVELAPHDDLGSGVDRRGGRVVDVVIDLQLITEWGSNHELLFASVHRGPRDHDGPEGDLRAAPPLRDVLVQRRVVGRDAARRGWLAAARPRQGQQRGQSDDRASANVNRPSSRDFPRITASAPVPAAARRSSRLPIPPE